MPIPGVAHDVPSSPHGIGGGVIRVFATRNALLSFFRRFSLFHSPFRFLSLDGYVGWKGKGMRLGIRMGMGMGMAMGTAMAMWSKGKGKSKWGLF